MSLAKIGTIVLEKNRLTKKRHSIRQKCSRAKRYFKVRQYYQDYSDRKYDVHYLPRKFRETPIREMKLTWLRLEQQLIGVKIELTEHTEKTTSEFKKLLKDQGAVLNVMTGDSIINGLIRRNKNGTCRYVDLVELYQAVEKHNVEQILLGGETHDLVDERSSFSA